MNASPAAFADRARGAFFSAPATLLDRAGRVSSTRTAEYYRELVRRGVDGLAVNAHTGRGPFLSFEDRITLIEHASELGVLSVSGLPEEHASDAALFARAAAAAGAEALLVYPGAEARLDPAPFLDAVWEASELPLIVFDLYLEPYDDTQFLQALQHPAVAGVKLARLYDALACQDRMRVVREHGKLAITGEDRMFGASLMWGADTALVGLGAAAVELPLEVFRSWASRDFDRFVRTSVVLDEFAATIFAQPFDGYVQRMLWTAVEEGLISEVNGIDRFAPDLPDGERTRVRQALAEALASTRNSREPHGVVRSA